MNPRPPSVSLRDVLTIVLLWDLACTLVVDFAPIAVATITAPLAAVVTVLWRYGIDVRVGRRYVRCVADTNHGPASFEVDRRTRPAEDS